MTPEEEQLAELENEVDEIEHELAAQEETLATLRVELAAFEADYRSCVAPRRARVDDLRVRLAGNGASPHEDLRELHRKASDSASVAGDAADDSPRRLQRPTDELRALYRRIARLNHPDLARDDEERERRTAVMARVNNAYEVGNLDVLKQVELQSLPVVEDDGSVGSRLVQCIRMRAAARARLEMTRRERALLMDGPLAELWMRVTRANSAGRNLLGEMCDELDRQGCA